MREGVGTLLRVYAGPVKVMTPGKQCGAFLAIARSPAFNMARCTAPPPEAVITSINGAEPGKAVGNMNRAREL